MSVSILGELLGLVLVALTRVVHTHSKDLRTGRLLRQFSDLDKH